MSFLLGEHPTIMSSHLQRLFQILSLCMKDKIIKIEFMVKGRHLTYRVFQKNFTLGISIIFPTINMPEGWDIPHLKGGIHSSIWSTKKFLYNIRKPIYKQNNKGCKISRILDNEQSNILKSDTSTIYIDFFSYEHFRRTSKGQVRTRHQIVQYLEFLKSNMQFWFASIPAP